MELTYDVTQTNWTKINDYDINTNWCKKVKKVKAISRRVYSVHTSQGEIRFRLTLRIILQLIQAYYTSNITIDSGLLYV